jgi:hypothetical protein
LFLIFAKSEIIEVDRAIDTSACYNVKEQKPEKKKLAKKIRKKSKYADRIAIHITSVDSLFYPDSKYDDFIT